MVTLLSPPHRGGRRVQFLLSDLFVSLSLPSLRGFLNIFPGVFLISPSGSRCRSSLVAVWLQAKTFWKDGK